MAYAIMGGLAVATLLTLVFLPALYVAWFGIKRPQSATDAQGPASVGASAPRRWSREVHAVFSRLVQRLERLAMRLHRSALAPNRRSPHAH
jgi:hypothetical protein